MIFYSAKFNGFFDEWLKKEYELQGVLPGDLVEVSESLRAEFLLGKMGYFMQAGNNGLPMWAPENELSHQQQIEATEQQKAALLAEAQATISLWQTELQLDIITDDDKTSLITWMKYIQALNAVDVSTAPDIEWPVKPE